MSALAVARLRSNGVPRAWHLIERNLFVYRRTWTVIVSGFFEPLFYLVGIGYGLGRLIGDVTGPGGEPIPYSMFVAPALLASGAMNGAVAEATFNFFFKLNYNRTFQSILATPLTVRDVAVGEIVWALIRGGLYAIGVVGVIWVMGLVASPWALLAVPAALLLGFAAGAVGMAATSFMRTPQDFDLINIVILPMFLFSATFYPIETYPETVRGIVAWTPLYQGVALIRGLTVGVVGPEMLVHVAYLLVMGGIGLYITSKRLDRVLLK
jgi:lipooligosaccharide transport system permease protein